MKSALDEALELEEDLALSRGRQGLMGFTCYTKPNYKVNWHHRLVARKLNAVARGEIKRLIICQPPRTGKSELVSVRLPPYLLGQNPDAQIIAASYNQKLANKMAKGVQNVMQSAEYQRLYPAVRMGSHAGEHSRGRYVRRADEFDVHDATGFYKATSVGGSATGYGMTIGIIDDPVKNRDEAKSIVYQERTWDWYTSTFYTRLESEGAIIVTATRWHAGDLIGRLLKQAKDDPEADQWEVVVLPALAERERHAEDPRAIDDPLWPEKYNKARLQKMKTAMGSRDWAALQQQRPTEEGGGVIKDTWWKWYDRVPLGLKDYTLSVDLTFEDRNDFACYQIWAAKGADRYLLDMVMKRQTFTEQCETFEMLCAKWPMLKEKLVENAANGAALIDRLKKTIGKIIPIKVHGKSKEGRAEAVAPIIEAGNVYLPAPSIAPWVNGFTEQWSQFPNGQHDDAVDACSQYLTRADTRVMDWGKGLPTSVRKNREDGGEVMPAMPLGGRRRNI